MNIKSDVQAGATIQQGYQQCKQALLCDSAVEPFQTICKAACDLFGPFQSLLMTLSGQ